MIKSNLNLIIISMFLFCILFFYYTGSPYNGLYYYKAIYSLADAYIYFLYSKVYGMLVLPFIIIFMNLITNDNVNYIIRFESMKNLIYKRIKKGILLSFTISFFAMLVVTIISSLQTATLINWNSETSIYLLKTGHFANISFTTVFIVAFATIFIRSIFVCLWNILIDLKFNNTIITFIIIFSIVNFETFQNKVPVFCKFLTINYRMWKSTEIKVLYVLYVVFTFSIYYFLMKKCIHKKEWL